MKHYFIEKIINKKFGDNITIQTLESDDLGIQVTINLLSQNRTINYFILRSELNNEISNYEDETGNCSACLGEKNIIIGWNICTGAKMGICNKCNGTGKIKNTEIKQ
jgi:hypothetical protein